MAAEDGPQAVPADIVEVPPKGVKRLRCNGYLFRRSKVCQGREYWSCLERHCPMSAVTRSGQLTLLGGVPARGHSHPPASAQQQLAQSLMDSLLRRVRSDLTTPMPAVYQEELDAVLSSVQAAMPSYEMLRSRLYRARQSQRPAAQPDRSASPTAAAGGATIWPRSKIDDAGNADDGNWPAGPAAEPTSDCDHPSHGTTPCDVTGEENDVTDGTEDAAPGKNDVTEGQVRTTDLPAVEYTQSRRGLPIMQCNSYQYRRWQVKKTDRSVEYWSCVRPGCRSTAVTERRALTRLRERHGHSPPAEARRRRADRLAAMRRRARAETTPIRQIHQQERQRAGQPDDFPSLESVKTVLYRERQRARAAAAAAAPPPPAPPPLPPPPGYLLPWGVAGGHFSGPPPSAPVPHYGLASSGVQGQGDLPVLSVPSVLPGTLPAI